MRRGEQSRSQTIGAPDAGAERSGAALAVGPGHNDRIALKLCAIHRKGIEQVGHPCQTNAVAIFRKIKHPEVPWPKMYGARFSGSDRSGQIAPAAGSRAWSLSR